MTKPKTPTPLLGPPFKLCETCGARIEREGRSNLEWLRKTFCGKACRFAAINKSSWKKRRVNET